MQLNLQTLFNEDFYLFQYLDVAAAVERGEISAFDHFVQFGQYQGRDPSILFDTSYYLERNPDVAAAVTGNETTAINHFINLGQFQGRDPSAIFNTSYYLRQNPDVREAIEQNQTTAISHFVEVGQSEGRDPSALFDATFSLKFPPPPPSSDSGLNVSVIANGLDNPRSLTFGPDGYLYVVEAGRGGGSDAPTIPAPELGVNLSYGATGAVTRIRDGSQERVITGLPSLARPTDGGGAYGSHSIGFGDNSDVYVATGFTSNPALRDSLGPVGTDLGHLLRFNLNSGNSFDKIADIVLFEGQNNPDGEDVVSNPYKVLVEDDSVLVLDAGANDLVRIDDQGNIILETVFASRIGGEVPMNFSLPVPIDVSPDGKAIIQSVPTSIVTGPDGAYYVSELTGYPFPEDGARIYKVMPGMEPVVYADGFTQIIDLAFGPDRSLYVLEYAANSLTSFNPTGALFQILPNGEKRNLNINGLIYPGGLAIGSDSDIYISNYSSLAGQGQVLRIDSPTSVPEPSSTFGILVFCILSFVLLFKGKKKKFSSIS